MHDDMLTRDVTATGILQCLRMLAEEAASLQLTRTLSVLEEAIETCVAERTDADFDIGDVVQGVSRVLH